MLNINFERMIREEKALIIKNKEINNKFKNIYIPKRKNYVLLVKISIQYFFL